MFEDIDPVLGAILRNVFLRCYVFDSEQTLRAVFVDSRIRRWYNTLPSAEHKLGRVMTVINHLSDLYTRTYDNALVLFIDVLREQTDQQDIIYKELSELHSALGQILQPKGSVSEKSFFYEPTNELAIWDWQKIAWEFIGYLISESEEDKSHLTGEQVEEGKWKHSDKRRLARWVRHKWTDASQKYKNRICTLYGTTRIFGQSQPVALRDLFTHVYIHDRPTAFRRFDIRVVPF